MCGVYMFWKGLEFKSPASNHAQTSLREARAVCVCVCVCERGLEKENVE